MITTLLTIIFPLYVLYIIKENFKMIPASISDSWYILQSNNPILKHLFTIWCYVVGLLLLSYYTYSFAFLLAGMGMMWVGTYTEFYRRSTEHEYIHFSGAVIAILASLIGLLYNQIYLPSIIMVLGTPLTYVIFKEKGTHIFWIEIVAFVSIILGLWNL